MADDDDNDCDFLCSPLLWFIYIRSRFGMHIIKINHGVITINIKHNYSDK